MYELIFPVQELIFAVQELIFPVQEFRSKSHMPLHAKHKRSTVWRPELDAQALSAREANEVSVISTKFESRFSTVFDS